MLKKNIEKKTTPLFFPLILATLTLAMIFSMMTGRCEITLSEVLGWLNAKLLDHPLNEYRQIDTILLNIRLPRILASMLVGSSLALAGTVYQSIFRNPMVSPCLLGASHGAGFGAALGILLACSHWMVQLSSFFFGITAVMIAYTLSNALGKRRDSVLMLVLSGIVVGSIFTSLISLTKYAADPEDTLPMITFWLMGSLTAVQMPDVYFLLIPLTIGILPMVLLRNKLNIMAFGDEEALSLGIDVTKVRLLFIICATIITAASVSICGIIGWVGLVIPHITRMLVGSNHNKLVPGAIFLGALYLMLVDDLSRTLFSVEIPLGIVTSLVGGPFFIFLLFRKERVW